MAKQIKENGVEAIVLMAASGHLMRVFATVLMSLEKINYWVPIIPVANAINPFAYLTPNMSQIPEDDAGSDFSQFEFCLGEAVRILNYKTDVAQAKLLVSYCDWVAKHSLLQFKLNK